MDKSAIHDQIDHLFRQESGKMVSVLVGIFGAKHLEMAEDVVQNTLIKALETWKFKGIPEHPKAWLYRVAKNNALDIIRRENRKDVFDFSDPQRQLLNSEYTRVKTLNDFWEEGRIQDEFLSMMFASCHPDISSENQITFILKILCGLSTKEIAKAFLTSEDVISKRIYRTKEYFRKNAIRPEIPHNDELENRVGAVSSAIYLLFNEGYNSTHTDDLIRKDLIAQALFLCKAMLDNEKTNLPEINALMALICLHASRIDSRTTSEGELITLKKQDRSKWSEELITAGRKYLFQSGEGERISIYHFEALIAYEHCIAENYASTNWKKILAYYENLLSYKYDPVIYLNKCLVILELKGPQKALDTLLEIANDKYLKNYYLYYSSLGEIYSRLGDNSKSIENFKRAHELTKSKQEKAFLKNKLGPIN